jgi:hypothetical protein
MHTYIHTCRFRCLSMKIYTTKKARQNRNRSRCVSVCTLCVSMYAVRVSMCILGVCVSFCELDVHLRTHVQQGTRVWLRAPVCDFCCVSCVDTHFLRVCAYRCAWTRFSRWARPSSGSSPSLRCQRKRRPQKDQVKRGLGFRV